MRLRTLALLCCAECRFPLSPSDPYLRPALAAVGPEGLIEGAIVCPRCSAWYPCESGLLDLRPAALQSPDRRTRIAARFALDDTGREIASHDAHKSQQERFFTEEADGYERDVVQSSFYQALDDLTVHRWGASLPADSVVLDVGAGTGRVALRLAERGHHVIALDLTEALLRQAQRKARDAGVIVDALIADAEHLPVVDGGLDAVAVHGVLHHLTSPALVVNHAGRALRDGGHWFSLDPHRSPFRGVFDAAMRLVPLWKEEAAPDGLQTEERLLAWCRAAGISAHASYSCYVLPHLLTPFPRAVARTVLRTTDWMFERSILRKAAGVIHVAGIKGPNRAA
jgi:SAM-dependent methyltransferase